MKSFFEIYYKLPPVTAVMLKSTAIFALTVIICSFAAFYLAEQSGYYYDMRVLSLELITALRSGFTVLSIGSIIMVNLEPKA